MASISNFRGMMLEEAILYLLRASGYKPVNEAGPRSQVNPLRGAIDSGGLWLSGRGSEHQIDAIADFAITLPFTNPNRLLVEAKAYADDRKIGVGVVRNTVGVLKDVQEYWVSRHGVPSKGRRHYQYAIFATSAFTETAQRFAFAHDIYIVPLGGSRFMSDVVRSILGTDSRHITVQGENHIAVSPSDLRNCIRNTILDQNPNILQSLNLSDDGFHHFMEFSDRCREVRQAFIAMIQGRFPLFLVPDPTIDVFVIPEAQTVRIFLDEDDHWFIVDQGNRRLFSFDLPPDLFNLYEKWADLTPKSIYNIKSRFLSSIQFVATRGEQVRVITLWLDQQWLSQVRDGLDRKRKN